MKVKKWYNALGIIEHFTFHPMQTPSENNTTMLLKTEEELFDLLVPADRPLRRLQAVLDMTALVEPLRDLYSDLGKTGIDIEKGFKALLVQFWEDYSDRQMEQAVRANMDVRWFCGFSLSAPTPDHSYFGKLRKRIGTDRLTAVFNQVNALLATQGLVGNVFTFVDASAVITKLALWEERDRAIKDGEETLNNAVVGKYAADTDARWGAKGKNKIWFGYKKHDAVDMKHGIITYALVTPANVLDFQVFDQLCPSQGMVFADKLYDVQSVYTILTKNQCASGVIQKNTRKGRNNALNRWRSSVRMPFESTFSTQSKQTRYRGLHKVQFQVTFESIVHNLKKAIRILSSPLTSPPRHAFPQG